MITSKKWISVAFAVLAMGCDDSDQPYSGLSRVNAEAYLVISDQVARFALTNLRGFPKHFCIAVYDENSKTPRSDSRELSETLQANKPAPLEALFKPSVECLRDNAGNALFPTGEPALELFAVRKSDDDGRGNWMGGITRQSYDGPGSHGSFFDVSKPWGELKATKVGAFNVTVSGGLDY